MTKQIVGKSEVITIPEQIGDFVYERTLGSGSFSVVVRVRHRKTNELFAIKVISKKSLIENKIVVRFEREITVFSQLNHPNITKFISVISDDNLIYIVMEPCFRGDLHSYIAERGKIGESSARVFVIQIALALKYLHDKGIAHRDLKPENILLDDALNVKIADFGFANLVSTDNLMSTHCGSPIYTAPEIISQQSYDGRMADMWSLGVIIFILVTGKIPWEEQSNQTKLFYDIQTARFHIPEFVSPLCTNLINGLMIPQPSMRLNASHVLTHPWLAEAAHAHSFPVCVNHQKMLAESERAKSIVPKSIPIHGVPKGISSRCPLKQRSLILKQETPETNRNFSS